MISLFPERGPINPVLEVPAEPRIHEDGTPWIYTNMVASLDGATAIDELSGGLGSPADKVLFSSLRSVADAIIVGAATAQAERYRPPSLTDEARSNRLRLDQKERPILVVVTSRLSFDLDIPMFTDETYRPIVATSQNAPEDKLAAVAERAEILTCGSESVELPTLIDQLSERGYNKILAEGGPTLNDQLIRHELVDEWNLSISNLLVGGPSARTAQGRSSIEAPSEMTLSRLWQGDDMLFGRWIKK